MMRIILKGVPPSLNRFAGRENTWEYRKAKSVWTSAAYFAARACKDRPVKPWEKAEVNVMYYFPDNRDRDPDNYSGKLFMDGLTLAKVIVDDSMRHITLTIGGDVDRRKPRTVITIKEEKQ